MAEINAGYRRTAYGRCGGCRGWNKENRRAAHGCPVRGRFCVKAKAMDSAGAVDVRRSMRELLFESVSYGCRRSSFVIVENWCSYIGPRKEKQREREKKKEEKARQRA